MVLDDLVSSGRVFQTAGAAEENDLLTARMVRVNVTSVPQCVKPPVLCPSWYIPTPTSPSARMVRVNVTSVTQCVRPPVLCPSLYAPTPTSPSARMGRAWIGTFQATAGFQDSDFFQKAMKMALRSILSVISHLSGFRL